MTESCPDCGRRDACTRCRIAARLANPHNNPAFRDGKTMCPRGLRIEEHDLIDGAFVCQKEATK